jgi:hypothetical protein
MSFCILSVILVCPILVKAGVQDSVTRKLYVLFYSSRCPKTDSVLLNSGVYFEVNDLMARKGRPIYNFQLLLLVYLYTVW